MEFAAYIDESPEAGDLLSIHRQRILAAQIQDSELGGDDVLLPTTDTFDNSVENSVIANESALMEMDEVITQLQQWRNRPTSTNVVSTTGTDGLELSAKFIEPISEYHSDAYDRIFKKERGPPGPESDEGDFIYTPREPSEKLGIYIEDVDVIAKLQSLQALIKESKSSAALHQQHVSEYQALMTLLKDRFGDNLETNSEDSDDESGSENENKAGVSRRPNNNQEESGHAHSTTISGNINIAQHSNNNKNSLDDQFRTIGLEVREGNYQLNRQQENEVIREGADLQAEVSTLEESLRDFSGDLDRLLLG